MKITAKSVLSRQRNSFEAGRQAALEIQAALPASPKLCLCYLTVNHEQQQFLNGFAAVLGPDVPVLGCSGQGVMGRGAVYEDGYGASVMALGGTSLEVAVTHVKDVHVDTRDKGVAMGRSMRQQLSRPPKVTVMHYDPLSGVDVDVLLGGVSQEIEAPILGGASAHFFNAAMTTTYQYFREEVFSKGAVAVSLAGDFSAEMAFSTGCASAGIEVQITRIQGNMLLELEGRPAVDVWRELTGGAGATDVMASSALAIGVPVEDADREHLVRAAFVLDTNTQGILLGAAIPEGTRVTLYHRTVEEVLDGATRMASALEQRLAGKQLRAVLGFECGGRTRPFLGMDATNAENRALQARFGAETQWAGVICWGELFPVGGRPGFHNYTFPLLAIAE